ncbi:MAG: hypothetical protein HS108_12115 [Planctomycetes bacterium]|nr:hypothetical protein [Planctomycetota bacterium]
MPQGSSRIRWHSRGVFLATTLLAVSALGGPFLVTRGLIEHGALFLPVVLALLLLLGAPVVRLALAGGRLDQRLAGREALFAPALLVRAALAAVLFAAGARACGWIADMVWLDPGARLVYPARELTQAAASWPMRGDTLAWGAGLMAVACAALVATAARRRLAGLGWIGGWLLWLMVLLFALGLVAGYALPGAGGLAALVARPRLEPLASARLWADAVSCALLAIGAQAGLLTAAGAGLPQRANVGREARILTASIGTVLVVTGLTGLVLLCAVCVRQGVVPAAEHASPELLLIELVPALGRELFTGWPPEWTPTARQITLGWQFMVALGAAFGVTALVGARRWLPDSTRSPAFRAGLLAAAVILAGVGADWWRGVPDAAEPLTKILPALLALMHLTLARRAGPGMRLVSAAFESGRPWVERLNVMLALRVARPLFVAAVPVLALAHRGHSLALAGMAIGFAAVWIGSLHTVPRSRATGLWRAAAGVLVLTALPLLGASAQSWAALEQVLADNDAATLARLRARVEPERAKAAPDSAPPEKLRQDLALALDRPSEPGPRRAHLRQALAVALLLAPEDPELQRLERVMLAADGVRPVRLDEALSEHAAGRPRALREQVSEIVRNLDAPNLRALLAAPDEPPTVDWHIALVADLARAYGTAPPLARDFRQHELRRALTGRSLLRPDASTAAVLLASLGVAATALALALVLGLAPRPDRE